MSLQMRCNGMIDDGCERLWFAWPRMVSVTHYDVAKLMILCPSLSTHTHTCTLAQYMLELAPRRSTSLT